MKWFCLTLFTVLLTACLSAQTIQETLAQIEATKRELAQNEQLVDQKITELRATNPLFALQDDFETDAEYETRKRKTAQEIDKLHKLYLDETTRRLVALRALSFETENILVTLGKYDTNSKIWSIRVSHGDYQQFDQEIQLSIEPSDARGIRDNFNRMIKTGIFCVDPGDKIGLARILFKDPVTKSEFSYDFQPAWSSGLKDVNKTALSPDGKYMAIVSQYSRLTLIDLGDMTVAAQLPHNLYISSLSFSADSKYLATSEDGAYSYFAQKLARIYCMDEFELVDNLGWDAIEPKTANIGGVALNHDGSKLAAIVERGQSCVVNVISGKVELNQLVINGNPLKFSPDGSMLLVDDSKGGLVMLRVSDGKLLKQLKLVEVRNTYQNAELSDTAFSPDGKYIVVAANKFTLLHSDSFKVKKEWEMLGSTPDEINERTVRWNNSKSSARVEPSVSFSADGRYLALSGFGETTIVEMSKLKTVKTFPVSGCVGFLAGNRQLMINDKIYRTFLDGELQADTYIAKLPASLDVTFIFSEPSGNDLLDALEKGVIKLSFTNKGQGSAKGIEVNISPLALPGLSFQKAFIAEIPAGKTVELDIPIEAYIDVRDGTQTLNISFEEANGFPPAPLSLTFSTRAYKRPELYISETGIDDSNKNGKIEAGEMIELTLRFRNRGAGPASAAYAKFYTGENVFITDKHAKTQTLGDLTPSATKDLKLEIFINERCANEIPLYVDLTEATGLAGVSKLRVPILKSDQTRPVTSLVVTGTDHVYDISEPASLNIDVETDLPLAKKERKDDYAVIFGVENYSGNVPRVLYATRDAAWFREYAIKTLGLPAENIYYRVNAEATKNEFDKALGKNGWLDKRAKKDSRVYFFFSGHGIPTSDGESSYILPYDGDPNYAELTAYPLQNVYAGLAGLKSSLNVVFLDACFTGINRENQALYATSRPVFISPNRMEAPPRVNVLSAAAWNQMSSAWPDKQHGLFSYFLLKGMQGAADANADRKLTLAELHEYLSREVPIQAARLDKDQVPQLSSEQQNEVWLEYK